MMKPLISFIVLLIQFLILASCNEPASRIAQTPYPGLMEKRLGQSSYYVSIPSTMFIEEARGKEGQHGYGIWLIDEKAQVTGSSGFIETKHGAPNGWKPFCDFTIEKTVSILMGKKTEWTICRSESGKYFSAIAYHRKLTLSASSPTRPGLDSMIAVISTLAVR